MGQAKTRIAKVAGSMKAKEIYLKLLKHTREVAQNTEASRLLFYADEIMENDDWSNKYFQKFVQSSGDLGDKMRHAFEVAFGNNDKVVIIGSDCPYITLEHIQQAYEALDEYDYVFGPADDGGYYLCGMKDFSSLIFDKMPWSTEHLLKLTLDKLEANKKSVCLLEQLSDVDYIEDWEKYLLSQK